MIQPLFVSVTCLQYLITDDFVSSPFFPRFYPFEGKLEKKKIINAFSKKEAEVEIHFDGIENGKNKASGTEMETGGEKIWVGITRSPVFSVHFLAPCASRPKATAMQA